MYLLSFLAVIFVSIFTIYATSAGLTGGWTGVSLYFDLWSFAVLIVLCVPILISSGLFKDFNNAFRLTGKRKVDQNTEKKEVTLLEIKRAIEAVSLVRKVLLAGGIFIVLITFVFILSYLVPNNSEWKINASIALLPLVYAFAADIFLLPIESKLKINFNDMIHQ